MRITRPERPRLPRNSGPAPGKISCIALIQLDEDRVSVRSDLVAFTTLQHRIGRLVVRQYAGDQDGSFTVVVEAGVIGGSQAPACEPPTNPSTHEFPVLLVHMLVVPILFAVPKLMTILSGPDRVHQCPVAVG